MSQQEAASIGPFEPISPQQQTSMAAGQEQHTPFARTGEGPAMPDYQAEEAAADSRSRRRRAWTVIALALVIPAGAAAALALILTGGDDAGPTESVTRVTTASESAAVVQTTTSTAAAIPAAPATTTGATTQQAAVAAQPASADATQAAQTGSAASTAGAATATADDATSTLSPEARLAAWPEIERIEVVTGETLWLLAQQYDTTVSAIALLNGITDPESLSVGQLLSIPVGFNYEVSLTGETVELAAATTEITEAGSSTDGGSVAITTPVTLTPAASAPDDLVNWANTIQLIIVAGDSLDAIANANGTTVEAIQILNGIADPNVLNIGQQILVPIGYTGAVSLPAPAVEPVDTTPVTVTPVEPVETTTTPVEPVDTTVDTTTVNTEVSTPAETEASAPVEDDMLETAEGGADGDKEDLMETE